MFHALANPPPCLTPLQRLLWPLIYVQLIALRDWVRKHYGRVPYWITISKFGRVRLHHLPTDLAQADSAPASYQRPGYDYASGLRRALLSAVFVAEITPPAPFPAAYLGVTADARAAQKKSGQAFAACPDTS